MSLLESGNAVVRFVLELCALAAFGFWGFRANDALAAELVAGLGTPVAFALAWGAWVAPKAPYRLDDPPRLVLEVVVFAAAAIALAAAEVPLLAAVFAVLVAVNIVLMFLLGQRGSAGI